MDPPPAKLLWPDTLLVDLAVPHFLPILVLEPADQDKDHVEEPANAEEATGEEPEHPGTSLPNVTPVDAGEAEEGAQQKRHEQAAVTDSTVVGTAGVDNNVHALVL